MKDTAESHGVYFLCLVCARLCDSNLNGNQGGFLLFSHLYVWKPPS